MLTSHWRAAACLVLAGLAGCAPGAARMARPGRTASPLAKHAVLLAGVSCTAASACTAVGSFYTSAAGPQRTLAERWDGHGWQAQRTVSRGAASQLASVSCVPGGCLAVGQPAQVWTGGRWRIAAGGAGLASLSCVSVT